MFRSIQSNELDSSKLFDPGRNFADTFFLFFIHLSLPVPTHVGDKAAMACIRMGGERNGHRCQ